MQIERTAVFGYTGNIMKSNTDLQIPTIRFSFLALGFIVLAWSAYAFAAMGAFSYGAIVAISVGSVAAAILAIRWLATESVPARIIFVLAMVYTVALLSTATPSVFSGRDQGSIAEAAIELSESGRFGHAYPVTQTFFSLYGPGKALNFPGFFYENDGSLVSQFPKSYIAWVGMFHSSFGLGGLTIGNGVLLVLSFLSLFMLVRTLADEIAAMGATLIAATSFLPSWFAKFTLTENLGLFLFLALSLFVVLFFLNPRRSHFLSAVLTAILLAVTRIEGLPILALTLALLFLTKRGESFPFTRLIPVRWATLLTTAIVLLADFFGNMTRYVSIVKAVSRTVSESGSAPLGSTSLELFSDMASFWELFSSYGLLLPLLLGLVGIVILAIQRNRIALIPAVLALPTFLYLVDPNISADHPWMLRRLLFSVWPAMVISCSAGIHALTGDTADGKRKALVTAAVVCLAGIVPTASVFTFSENPALLEETHRLADTIGSDDLVLIDRTASGDPYAIIAGPLRFLYGKNAVYFFNSADYAKIPLRQYRHTYLLSPADEFERWSGLSASLSPVKTFSFTAVRLGPLPLEESRFPDKTSVTTNSILFRLDPL